MRVRVVRLAILAYPRRWRRRYGPELEQLTLNVLERPWQSEVRRLRIVLGLVTHGVDERFRRAESAKARATVTSISVLLAGMFVLGGGLAADAVWIPNVQISASIRLGAGVSVVRRDRTPPTGPASIPGQVTVLVPRSSNPQVFVKGRSAVVINTKSGQVVSVKRSIPRRQP